MLKLPVRRAFFCTFAVAATLVTVRLAAAADKSGFTETVIGAFTAWKEKAA